MVVWTVSVTMAGYGVWYRDGSYATLKVKRPWNDEKYATIDLGLPSGSQLYAPEEYDEEDDSP